MKSVRPNGDGIFTFLWTMLRDLMTGRGKDFLNIVHRKVKIPSPLGLTLFMSAFEDLLSLRTRAYLIKDVDPEILRRLLGARSLATELDRESLDSYYQSKVQVPKDAELSLIHISEPTRPY